MILASIKRLMQHYIHDIIYNEIKIQGGIFSQHERHTIHKLCEKHLNFAKNTCSQASININLNTKCGNKFSNIMFYTKHGGYEPIFFFSF